MAAEGSTPRVKTVAPDSILLDQESVNAFYQHVFPQATNWRLGDVDDSLFYLLPDPPKPVPAKEYRDWQDRVRAGLVRQSRVIKGWVPALQERARV